MDLQGKTHGILRPDTLDQAFLRGILHLHPHASACDIRTVTQALLLHARDTSILTGVCPD